MIRRAQDRENVLSLLDDAPFFAAEMRAEWDARGPESFFLVDDGAVLLLRGGFAKMCIRDRRLGKPNYVLGHAGGVWN